MERFDVLRAVAAPFPFANVDTDRIIRVERCVRTPRAELGRWAFETERFAPDGSERDSFVLHRAPFRGAGILVASENFGCGSSREMAVWAVAGMGIRCVIAPSFGEIFFGNCFQNGLLPLVLPAATVEALAREAAAPGAKPFTVDLERQTVNGAVRFEIEPRRKKMLLEGLDEIGLTLAMEPKIAAFQAADRARRPWIYPA